MEEEGRGVGEEDVAMEAGSERHHVPGTPPPPGTLEMEEGCEHQGTPGGGQGPLEAGAGQETGSSPQPPARNTALLTAPWFQPGETHARLLTHRR